MFGAGQRILDSLRLNDKTALLILIMICIGLIIPPIWIGKYFCFSIGGFLIPFALSVYLLISCGWSRDLARAVIGTILVAGIIYALEWLLPADPEEVLIDNMYIYGVVAGLVAYFLGRSRRNAFISCLFGLTLAEFVQWCINFARKTPSILGLGVGGAFGTYVISIIIAVAVSEFMGRCFECAAINKEEKAYNYKTNTYDSEKNGKLDKIKTQKEEREEDISEIINIENEKDVNILKSQNDNKNADFKQNDTNILKNISKKTQKSTKSSQRANNSKKSNNSKKETLVTEG